MSVKIPFCYGIVLTISSGSDCFLTRGSGNEVSGVEVMGNNQAYSRLPEGIQTGYDGHIRTGRERGWSRGVRRSRQKCQTKSHSGPSHSMIPGAITQQAIVLDNTGPDQMAGPGAPYALDSGLILLSFFPFVRMLLSLSSC